MAYITTFGNFGTFKNIFKIKTKKGGHQDSNLGALKFRIEQWAEPVG